MTTDEVVVRTRAGALERPVGALAREPGAAGACEVTTLGSVRHAERTARRAERCSPAYRDFLRSSGPARGFLQRPLTSKADYILRYPWADLVGANGDKTYAVAGSAASTGQIFYWPMLRSQQRLVEWGLRKYLERRFAIHRRRSLVLVSLHLGSWWTGNYVAWALQNLGRTAGYPITIFIPGNRLEETVDFVAAMEGAYEQVILYIYPSVISHLLSLGERTGKPLPLGKLRFVVLGEPFPEELRMALGRRSGFAPGDPFLSSTYGSADTGLLGTESRASIALRQLLTSNPSLAAALGFAGPVPLLFHKTAWRTYLETVDGELCVTRWLGIPLVRYNLRDSARLFRWRPLRAAVLASRLHRPQDAPLLEIIGRSSRLLPDLVAVSGRSDRCLLLGAIKITRAMLDAAVHAPELEDALTGVYLADIRYDGEWQHLQVDLEVRQDAAHDDQAQERIRRALVRALLEEKPVLRQQWEQSYRLFDDDPGRRAIRVALHGWPALSDRLEGQVKHVPIAAPRRGSGGPAPSPKGAGP